MANATMSEARWSEIKRMLPAGSRVTGTVVAHRPFGFFISVPAFPDITALVEITAFTDGVHHPVGLDDFPPVGSSIHDEVLYFADGARQLRLGRVEVA